MSHDNEEFEYARRRYEKTRRRTPLPKESWNEAWASEGKLERFDTMHDAYRAAQALKFEKALPLHHAIETRRSVAILKRLLVSNSGLSLEDTAANGMTPLVVALKSKAGLDVLELLIKGVQPGHKGADVNRVEMTRDFAAPLHEAVRFGCAAQVLQRLISAGADVSLKDGNEQTAMDIAQMMGASKQIVDLLYPSSAVPPANRRRSSLFGGLLAKTRSQHNLKPVGAGGGDLALPKDKKYHVFAGHAWGKDAQNHQHVSLVVAEMEKIGLTVWFDENKLSGNISAQISKGIESSFVFLAFVSTDYLEKIDTVDQRDGTDWCEFEFTAALQSHGKRKMVPIVCEPALLNPKTWFGPVKVALSGMMYVDFSHASHAKQVAEQVRKVVQERLDQK